MPRGIILPCIAGAVLLACTLLAQKPFREYPGWEYSRENGNGIAIPPDYKVPGEWTFARMMYPSTHHRIDWQSEFKRGYDWHEGNTNWTIDYPRSDRHLAQAIRRLTRIDVHSVEQPVNLDEDEDVFNYPWLYAVEVGHWELTDRQIARFREFLDRGGFFMCDDFHGTDEWNVFVESMRKVFPDRPIVDIQSSDQIFHTVFDLDERYQVPGAQYEFTHSICEKCPTARPPVFGGGDTPRWRGIYDEHGRLMVAICHNMDLGDSWENADDPRYPQKFSALGIRLGVDYVVYSMTH
jgi:outer membrane biogenesis lipoprotein LolB